MRIEKRDGNKERTILVGMVTDKIVLGRIAANWKDDLFSSVWSNILGGWCVEYYKKYDSPPNKSIEGIYQSWVEGGNKDKATVRMMESFLEGLSDEYENQSPLASDYILDMAGEYFERVRLSNLAEAIQGEIDLGHITKARDLLNNTTPVEIGVGAGIDLFNDLEAIKSIFSQQRKDTLIKMPGALGTFFQRSLERDGFLAFLAGEKVGKTFWLVELAYQALRSRKRVAFFSVGDMSLEQIGERFLTRAARIPSRSFNDEWPMMVKYPRKLIVPGGEDSVDDGQVLHKQLSFKESLDVGKAWKEVQKFQKTYLRSQRPYLRVSSHPNTSISVEGIKAILKTWEMGGWNPDVVCIAEGSLVLTNRGLVPIESVSRNDKLWDGVNWVEHGGIVYKGERDVITYAGLTATPDHQVWTESGWRTLESCSQMGLRIAQTGDGRKEIRIGRSYISDNTYPKTSLQKIWEDLQWKERIYLCPMCQMRIKEVDMVIQHQKGNLQRMPFMYAAQEVPQLAMATYGGGSSTLPEPQLQKLETLRREGYSIPIPFNYSGLYLDCREFGSTKKKNRGIGSDRQRRSLRTGEYPSIYQETEYLPHKETSPNNSGTPFSSSLSRCGICGFNIAELFQEGNDSRTNSVKMDCLPGQIRRKKTSVWDILSTGPLHRFTVQGLLVHNCIDYADILAPMGGYKERRHQIDATWRGLRALSQSLHCLVLTATQADTESYSRSTLTRRNFSESKTIHAHVTGMVGINQTEKEKDQGIYRLNWIDLREGEYSFVRCCYTAACLSLSNPAVLSAFPRRKRMT